MAEKKAEKKETTGKKAASTKKSTAKAVKAVKVETVKAADKTAKPAKSPAVAKKTVSGSVLKIKQVRSAAGRLKNQAQSLKGLGLGRLNRVVEVQDNPSTRGMINTVKHLIEVL